MRSNIIEYERYQGIRRSETKGLISSDLIQWCKLSVDELLKFKSQKTIGTLAFTAGVFNCNMLQLQKNHQKNEMYLHSNS